MAFYNNLGINFKLNLDDSWLISFLFKIILISKKFINVCYIIGGAWLLYYRNSSENFQSVFNLATDLGGYLIAIGVIGIIFSLLAIAGTFRENVFILRMVYYLSNLIKHFIFHF